MCLFKHYPNGRSEAVIKTGVALPTHTAKAHDGFLMSYSAFVNSLLKQYASEDDNATVRAEIQTIKHQNMTAIELAQRLWIKTFQCGSF